MKSFLQNGDSEIAKITTFTHQRWPCTRQPSWNSSTTISFQTIYSLEQELEEGLPHNGYSKIAKIIPFTRQDGHAISSHLGILQPTYSFKPYILLIRKLMEGFQQYGDSETAKITPFTHQRWPCTIQPSWNSSTNIFQTIKSLAQKLYGRLPTIRRLRNS